MENPDTTIGFDATTQEGVHINGIHVTFKMVSPSCLVIAVDQLAGGTAEDYENHICASVDNLAEVYSSFSSADFQDTRGRLIGNISNTMSDRVASNHAAIRLLNEAWDKTHTELNCHLHPLDSFASSSRSALKALEPSKGKLWGTDCSAANVVLAMNKMRFKDGKGDPQGFKTFLVEENLGKGFVPRYRGNRLHILYHISGKYFAHHSAFGRYLVSSGPNLGGLRASLVEDFNKVITRVELQVLGLLGKHLTGPWMVKFYTSAVSEVHHIEGINIVKDVLGAIKELLKNPSSILMATSDFFGNKLDTEADTILKALQQEPDDMGMFEIMMDACLESIFRVLEKQYDRYFQLDITEELKKQTESARSHNIDAEEIMGCSLLLSRKPPMPRSTSCPRRYVPKKTGW